jgi:hypothetical protein
VTNSDILTLGDFANVATNGTITVNGLGSTWTQTGASTVIIGAPASSTAILNLQSGGTFTSGTGSFTINSTGVVNLDGGTLTLNGPITNNGTLNFNAGALNLSENITIGIGGLFGTSLTLESTQHLSTTATTIIDFFRVLTLNGGTLTTSELLNNGTLAFNSGTLAITGAGRLRDWKRRARRECHARNRGEFGGDEHGHHRQWRHADDEWRHLRCGRAEQHWHTAREPRHRERWRADEQ